MNDRLENIIKYLDNEMSADERMAFENQLRNDEVLAKEVAFQRGLHGFLDRQKPNLEQKLSNLGDEFILNPPTKKTSFSTLKIIGILSLLALVSYFSFFLKNNTTTN
ncbi:MAG: anti-sigma factor family protein, partial [Saprospiraceae bacterium]